MSWVLRCAVLLALLGVAPVADAGPYVGESVRANVGILVRGTDGGVYAFDLTAVSVDGPAAEAYLVIGTGPCGEHGCSHQFYQRALATREATFGAALVTLRAVVGGLPVEVTWRTRRSPREGDLTEPDLSTDDGVRVETASQTTTATATVRIGAMRCTIRRAGITTATAAGYRSDATAPPPAKLARGFYATSRRTPRCY